MKVVIITAATNTIPRFRIDMIDEFVKHGADVVVFGDESEEDWKDYFQRHSVSYRTYHVSRNGMNPIRDLKTQKQLRDLLDLEQPDKIFTYQAKPNIYGTIAAHHVGITEIYVMMGGLGSIFRANDLVSRIVRFVVTEEYRYSLRFAKKVFFQNDEDSELLVGLGLVRSNQVVRINGSGVNIEYFAQKPLPKKLSFVFVGRLVRGKGVMEYLEAARMVKETHPEVEFNLVGPYDTNPSALQPSDIQSYIDDGSVIYHGEQKDVRPYLEAASVFVLPSYYGEGTPKSALEAMSMGRPLIVADAVGCREVVQDGVNGFLVKPKDSVSLKTAIERLVNDRELIKRFGKESRSFAEKNFDVKKVNDVICMEMDFEK